MITNRNPHRQILSNPRGLARVFGVAALALLSACAPAPSAANNNAAPVPTPTMDMSSVPTSAAAPTAAAIPVTGPHVTIANFTFSPATLTVPTGSTVTWVNQDDTAHTVTSVDKVFGSQGLDTGDTFTFKFSKPGTYAYFCTIHPEMTGKIIVK